MPLDPPARQEALIQELLATPDVDQQKQLLAAHVGLLNQSVVDALKQQADRYLRSEINHSLDFATLILEIATLTTNPVFLAWGLLARGNALSIGLGEYKKALLDFDEALHLFGAHECWIEQARVEIGRTVAFICLGEFQNAFKSGAFACRIFREHQQWHLLATATMNLGIAHFRAGEDAKALDLYDQALALLTNLEDTHKTSWGWIQNNRVVCLRNLGRFDEAIATSQLAQEEFQRLGQTIEAARARQNMGITYYVLGRYNEALDHFDQVYPIFTADNRRRDAAMLDLFISDCLLRLGQFEQVLEKCQRVRRLFDELDAKPVVAQTIVNEAVAYIRLGRESQGIDSLHEAQRLFQQLGNAVWVAMTQIELANVLQQQKRWEESFTLIQNAAQVLGDYGLVIEQAQAYIIGAQAALALERQAEAQTLIDQVSVIGRDKNLPSLLYQSYQLAGAIQESYHQPTAALAAYDQAIQELEQLRGRLMVEHRADFLADKEVIYENAVNLCLTLNQAEQGLLYAERAKSRTLLDLVAYKLDLSIQARRTEDVELVEEINQLRIQRDQYYRRWETNEEIRLRGWTPTDELHGHQQEMLTLEKRITELWHKLLVHNADYARDAALWQVQAETGQDALPAQTALLEYFVVNDRLVAFIVTGEGVRAVRLDCTLTQVRQALDLLQMNLHLAARSKSRPDSRLLKNVQGRLYQLYEWVFAPLATWLPPQQSLIIVPHSALHYLPFHALYNGTAYLIEERELRYLPGSSFLRYCRRDPSVQPSNRRFVYANSWHGRIPSTLHEGAAIAQVFGITALTNDEIGQAELQRSMADAQIVHLATHGDFRADNPLFSGLWIGDGWLTTLDIFNMRLNASLVTLSGCQTGRNVVQAGDELAGLMRAFLSAGAASLILSLWSVEDEATAQLMQSFYQYLTAGEGKGAALRSAQLAFIRGAWAPGGGAANWQHPFYWAPFFLVGDAGPV
jgi:CHAT domain-containing protein/tetratricopeptide (TPR) repeat protein